MIRLVRSYSFPTRIEPFVYTFTELLPKDYKGGYWTSNAHGRFYMVPAGYCRFHVICENKFEGDLSSDTLGITVCLYAYSNLSFAGPDSFVDICNDQYYRLRELMMYPRRPRQY